MWQVYRLLKSGLPKKEEEYLLHEIIRIMDGISTENFKEVLRLMSKKDVPNNPLDAALLFARGLKLNEFFYFTRLVSGFAKHAN